MEKKSRYIRTKDGVYEVVEENDRYYKCKDGNLITIKAKNKNDINGIEWAYKQADTIEDLIQDLDIIYIYDCYPDAVLVIEGNIKPFGYDDKITLKEWLKFKHTEFELYLKQSNGDYHKVASKKPYEKLVLI